MASTIPCQACGSWVADWNPQCATVGDPMASVQIALARGYRLHDDEQDYDAWGLGEDLRGGWLEVHNPQVYSKVLDVFDRPSIF